MVFLAGRDRYTQRSLHRDVHARLDKQAGCEKVRYRPSRRRPQFVIADVDPVTFLRQNYPVDRARLELRFWYSVSVGHEYYRINWVEPTRNLMVGFHQDADHPDLGPCHVQLDYDGATINRHETAFLDAHPLSVLDERLRRLPTVLDALVWRNGQPSLPNSQE